MEEKKLIVDKVNPEWHDISPEDLWYYNKLILSRTLGYDCGPTGVVVPKPGFFIVRPCMNYLKHDTCLESIMISRFISSIDFY